VGSTASHRTQAPAASTTASGKRGERRKGAWFLVTVAGVTLGLASLQPRAPVLIWNFTTSVPVGLYRIEPATPAKGDILAIAPEGALRETLNTHAGLPAERLLLKQLAAVPGDTVCRNQTTVTINGVIAAKARLHSRAGLPLPAWNGCRTLGGGEAFLLGPHASSFDSRYFGPIDDGQIVGVARPILTASSSQEIP